tara:strand:+ start:189 stop:488 length:300 start_codon:yes stop_codon:yes gene_type:complete
LTIFPLIFFKLKETFVLFSVHASKKKVAQKFKNKKDDRYLFISKSTHQPTNRKRTFFSNPLQRIAIKARTSNFIRLYGTFFGLYDRRVKCVKKYESLTI